MGRLKDPSKQRRDQVTLSPMLSRSCYCKHEDLNPISLAVNRDQNSTSCASIGIHCAIRKDPSPGNDADILVVRRAPLYPINSTELADCAAQLTNFVTMSTMREQYLRGRNVKHAFNEGSKCQPARQMNVDKQANPTTPPLEGIQVPCSTPCFFFLLPGITRLNLTAINIYW